MATYDIVVGVSGIYYVASYTPLLTAQLHSVDAVQCNAVQCSAVQYNDVQIRNVQYINPVQC